MTRGLVEDRFNRFAALFGQEPLITNGEFEIHCCGGGIHRCNARYEGGGLDDTPIIPPKGFQDKTEVLSAAFEAMIGHITGTGFGGTATLSVKSFLGKVYKIKVGFDQEWQGE
jgi:hypothetical protein